MMSTAKKNTMFLPHDLKNNKNKQRLYVFLLGPEKDVNTQTVRRTNKQKTPQIISRLPTKADEVSFL